MRARIFLGALAMLVSVAMQAVAMDPQQVIQKTTDSMLATIDEAKGYYEQEPQRYFANIEAILDSVVDFPAFSRAVMGPFASEERYAGLSEEERAKLDDQVARFNAVFKAGMVETYGKGFLAFGLTKVEVKPAQLSKDGVSAQVIQLVYGISDKPYQVKYLLRKEADSWMLRNVTIDAINLGKIYRNQFVASVKKYEGDIDAVIDNWSVGTDDIKESE